MRGFPRSRGKCPKDKGGALYAIPAHPLVIPAEAGIQIQAATGTTHTKSRLENPSTTPNIPSILYIHASPPILV